MKGPYFFALRGEISRGGPGAGMSFGNMSTHISILPYTKNRSNRMV